MALRSDQDKISALKANIVVQASDISKEDHKNSTLLSQCTTKLQLQLMSEETLK